MTFSNWPKCTSPIEWLAAWIFAFAFQLSSTTFPCIFLPGLHFVSEKNKDKIFKRAQWPQQSRTRAFQPEKRYRRMFFYLIKKHMQKFRYFWRKKNSPEKVTCVPLAPNHSIEDWQKHRNATECHICDKKPRQRSILGLYLCAWPLENIAGKATEDAASWQRNISLGRKEKESRKMKLNNWSQTTRRSVCSANIYFL